MNDFLHAADLHLTARSPERDYSLRVLDEIVTLARTQQVKALLLSGDVFDTFADLHELRGELRQRLQGFDGVTLYLPGNHEALGQKGTALEAFDVTPARFLCDKPYTFLRPAETGLPFEILAIPHQNSFEGFADWPVPEKETKHRLALAHGTVCGMTFTGPNAESGGAVLDPQLFCGFEVDYAALGHIHEHRWERSGSTWLVYPGSARVWRKGEDGARGVVLGRCEEGGITFSFEPLSAAGQYRAYDLAVGLDGTVPPPPAVESWSPEDYVHVRLHGLVEDENAVTQAQEHLREVFADRVRRFEVTGRDDISVLGGIAEQPLAQRFLQRWEEARPPADDPDYEDRYATWMKARELGLKAIRDAMEGRSS